MAVFKKTLANYRVLCSVRTTNTFRSLVVVIAVIASLTVTSVASAAGPEPVIKSVVIGLPTSTDPAMAPSARMVTVHINFESMPDGCAGQSFRYANEDGNWNAEPVYIQRPYIQQSAGYGYKGVFVQYYGTCNGKTGPLGNIVYTRYTLPRPAATVPDPATAGEPRITKVTVGLPTKPMNGANLPSEFLPSVNITNTQPNNCTISEFRYANEDGNWKTGTVSRTRPLITPSAGFGYKGVYVQLIGTCNDKPVRSNIVYTRYTLTRFAATVPDPATANEPLITKVTIGLPTKPVYGANLPSEFLPSVNIINTQPDNCTISEFRYANEDGNWKTGTVSRTRPLITPSAGFGYKGVYVQLIGTCNDKPVRSNIVFTRYTLTKLT